MKKFLVTLMTLALLLMLTVASAESVPAINWADVNVESTGIAGTWYTFDNVALKIWVPDIFQDMDLTAEEAEQGIFGKFAPADQTAAIFASYHQGQEGATMDDLISTIKGNGVKDAERVLLNGLDAVTYSMPEADAMYVAFVTESGNIVQFSFMPASDEGFAAVAQIVSASIMAEE